MSSNNPATPKPEGHAPGIHTERHILDGDGPLAGAVAASLDCLLIRAGRSKKGLVFPKEVLFAAQALFDSAPCFIDHAAAADLGRPGGRSVRDVLGLFSAITWDPVYGGIRGRLLLRRDHAWVLDLIDLFRSQPERFGLSADITLTRKGATVTDINEVHSVDIVMNPAAGGRFLATSSPPTSTQEAIMSAPSTDQPITPLEPTSIEPPTPAVEPTSPFISMARELLAARIASAGVPEPMARIARATFADTGDLDEALSVLDGLKAAWAQSLAPQTVRHAGAVSNMRTGQDRIELAFERLMGLDLGPEHQGVPRLTGIRELYDTLTGDWERHGVYRGDRVAFANATTTTMAEIVRNVLNKVMLRAFEMRPQWWRPIAYEDDFPNMQTVRWLTVGGISDLDTVAEGASYTEKTWDDYAETASFVKKGNYIGLTLEMIDKDDVGAVRALPRRIGHAANRTLSAAVSALFTANAGVGPTLADGTALFDAAGHGNLGATALAAASWDAAIQAMFKQAEFHSAKRLGIRPKFVLVPIELEATALTIMTSDQLPGTPNNDANVRRYSAQIITVPEWTDNNDWAAVADPAELEGVCIGYRFGRAPELYIAADELMGSMFTNDEMRIKVRFVYAVGIGDYRALYKANVT
jgi:hypothetical protein